ncbi:MAG: methionyl-tRNA formyltransferase, partial [archaeon]
DLPKGRGRSPMNWALILDKSKFYTNLFKYEEGIDNGKIVGKQMFRINRYDTIETLHFKNRIAMNKLIEDHIYDILNDNISLKEQNDEKATYYPKRKPKDGFIDWNLKTKDIYNLMRALTKPYPGLFTKLGNKKLYFWDLRPFTEKIKFDRYEPGTIIEKLHNGKIIVKTVDSSVIVHEYKFEGDDSEIEEGRILESKSTSEIYDDIESRYYDFVDETQKEITKEKILDFYELR